ncbi:MAG: D-tyrosyl-tRNA(Tyr) deacylase [Bacteroidales bacterium]|nr:D-tyrosyl-tRNA(Tyr) deacylase [Bacteroidales bacterium]
MRIVIQRVKNASVTIEGSVTAAIQQGMLVLVGVEDADTAEDVEWLVGKVMRLRIFDDAEGVMNLPITDVSGGDILVVSQFTLMASTRKGNRPSYIRASRPEVAIPLYNRFVESLSRELGHPVPTGVFGADMKVSLVNDGPVTIIIDSHLRE